MRRLLLVLCAILNGCANTVEKWHYATPAEIQASSDRVNALRAQLYSSAAQSMPPMPPTPPAARRKAVQPQASSLAVAQTESSSQFRSSVIVATPGGPVLAGDIYYDQIMAQDFFFVYVSKTKAGHTYYLEFTENMGIWNATVQAPLTAHSDDEDLIYEEFYIPPAPGPGMTMRQYRVRDKAP